MAATPEVWSAIAAAVALVVVWLFRVNSAMKSVPEEIAKAAPKRWTSQQIRETFERLEKNPTDFKKHLPPRLDRRYVVFGGAGMVGGDIVLQLLLRGQAPESIRIVDFQPVNRADMVETAKGCDFVKADMTSPASVEAAFSKRWPASVARKPLTVYHTAAMINPADRSERLYERLRRVNVDGTANVVEGAKKAGADIFVMTSSASISFHPADLWVWPWQSVPKNYVHIASEADFDAPIRPHDRFFANYCKSKAEAERIVCGANREGFRTGAIRPGNVYVCLLIQDRAIYGQKTDPMVGMVLTMKDSATWIPHVIQGFVDSRNVALAHLLFEAALARKSMPGCAGRPFCVTDAGPPIPFGDVYQLLREMATPRVTVAEIPPVMLLIAAYMIETYVSVVTRLPFLAKIGIREPKFPINYVQPAVLRGSVHCIIDDSAARRSVEDGGLGYQAVVDSLTGISEEVLQWNREHEGSAAGAKDKIPSIAPAVKAVGG
ncbi:hypothetical protein QBC47DRAFT_214103 [Echria macrotheca]|uniref:3-beta hydroxysteroid dehydrogenase/isomerase domain-containing protein n=1 Tax=Echria macrotheca TaxID=438768 RepID=A0AAJ0BEH8_9PEZI|nr:hypothetical protein QBC47DRAFT_214103 [Echria macrotheca]